MDGLPQIMEKITLEDTSASSALGCFLVDPWFKFWQGQSTLGWLNIPLVGIQNPDPQKILEVKSRALSRLSAFIACAS